MKNKHTPGPWRVEVCKAGQSSITGLKYEDSIIQPINVLAERHAAGEISANAALIAAAPDILDALEKVLLSVEKRKPIMIGEIRAIVKKAKGL